MGVILNEAKTKLDVDKVLESSIDRAGNVLLPMSLDDAGTTIRTVPLARFARVVAGVGHLDRRADADGIRRSEPLIRSLGNDPFPSLSLLAAANALGASVRDVLSGRLSTPGSLRPHAYRAAGGASVFPIDSFADVLSGRTSTEKYRDQIVLIGATGGAGLYLPSRDPANAPVFGLADGVSSILERHWITVPEWAAAFGLGVFATLALYLNGVSVGSA